MLVLDRVPRVGSFSAPANHATELNEHERQARVDGIAPERADELFHAPGVTRRLRCIGITFALVPNHAGNGAAVLIQASNRGPVQAAASFIPPAWIPLSHAGTAVGAGKDPLGDARAAVHFLGERNDRADAGHGVFFGAHPAAEIDVDLVDAVPHVMDRILRHRPAIVHVKRPHQRQRPVSMFPSTAALHVGLAGGDPDIADQHIADGDLVKDPAAVTDGNCDRVRPAAAEPGQPRAESTADGAPGWFPACAIDLDLDRASGAGGAGHDHAAAVARIALQDHPWKQAAGNLHGRLGKAILGDRSSAGTGLGLCAPASTDRRGRYRDLRLPGLACRFPARTEANKRNHPDQLAGQITVTNATVI